MEALANRTSQSKFQPRDSKTVQDVNIVRQNSNQPDKTSKSQLASNETIGSGLSPDKRDPLDKSSYTNTKNYSQIMNNYSYKI